MLSVEDHVALLKGLTLAERHAEWQGGSVSPIIWVYRSLEQRVSMEAAQVLARWVRARSRNPYAPFGSTVLARHFRPDEDLRHRSGVLTDLLKSRRLSDHLARAAEHERRTQAAKAERLERREKEVRLHRERKAHRDSIRSALIAEGDALDAQRRLRVVAERTDLPLLAFPPEWAEVSDEVIVGLPRQVMAQLEARVACMKRGSWSGLAVMLRRVLGPACPSGVETADR